MQTRTVRGDPARKLWLVVVAALAVLAATAGTASAQTPKFGPPVAMTGQDAAGRQFKGTYTIERFVTRGGRLFAVGDLKGTVQNRRVTRRNVRVPASIAAGTGARAAQATPPIPPTPNACQVLNLVLGPIDLNLLGLRVRTNQIRVLIEGVPGGGLLGDLICGITNLLNPSANTPLAQITRLLNALLALQGTPAVR